ncbi:hypothetical protein V1477_013801 [Vespula maculifrons]|uniref:Odorant receptor n=1 Tax=Vespula maculifrons TaxID=7453 RepID=A0ABD2BPW3_VESMC
MSTTELILPFRVEYFMKNQMKYYFILLFEYAIIIIGSTIGIANYSMFIAVIQHACALFLIMEWKVNERFKKPPQNFYYANTNDELAEEKEWIIGIIEFYNNAIEFMRKIRYRIKCDWGILENKPELELLKKYADVSRRCTVIIAVSFYLNIAFKIFPSLFCIFQYIFGSTSFTGLILPLHIEYSMENQIKYYFILFNQYVIMIIVATVGIANYSMFIAVIQHACALFHIVEWRVIEKFKKDPHNIYYARTSSDLAEENEWIIDIIQFYNNAIEFMKKIRYRIKCDWQVLQNKPELEILKKYADVSRRCTIIIAISFYLYVAFLIFPSVLCIFRYIFGTMSTTELILPFHVEYFMKNQMKYYFALFTEYVIIIIICTVGIANYSMFIAVIQHACALFLIMEWKVNERFKKPPQNFYYASSNDELAEENEWIIDVIEFYNNAVKFVSDFTNLQVYYS